MKFVATPRPEKNDRKSIVGPWIVALRPPAHSTWATLSPPRSADCAIDSALSTFGVEGGRAVRERLTVDVERVVRRAVDARPRAGREAVPARAVFGGACVRRPFPVAEGPLLEELGHRGQEALGRVLRHEVLPQAVRCEEDGGVGLGLLGWAVDAAAVGLPAARFLRVRAALRARSGARLFGIERVMSLRTSPGTGVRWVPIV